MATDSELRIVAAECSARVIAAILQGKSYGESQIESLYQRCFDMVLESLKDGKGRDGE
ncbi:MAG: hypothetical protein ACREQC_09145 [Candidatus Binataceae bacterium]